MLLTRKGDNYLNEKVYIVIYRKIDKKKANYIVIGSIVSAWKKTHVTGLCKEERSFFVNEDF